MLLKYPWFRVSRPLVEQEWTGKGPLILRWVTPPGRFVAVDTRIMDDFEVTTRVIGTPFRLLRFDYLTGIYWWAIRDDAWWVPLAVAFDRCYWHARSLEIHLIRFCIDRGWVRDDPGATFSWRKSREAGARKGAAR